MANRVYPRPVVIIDHGRCAVGRLPRTNTSHVV